MALFLALIALLLIPVVNSLVRYATLGSVALLATYTLWLGWNPRGMRFSLLVGALLGLALLTLTGKALPASELRAEYIRSLQAYEGTDYVWGGENHLGIDCSGLVRAGLMDTYLKLGLLNLSPQYLRQAFKIWFYDAGADTLAQGFRHLTRPVLDTGSLNQLDPSLLNPGDLMVDKNRVHTMIYLGDKTWIEADPSKGKVIKVKLPSTIGWFKIPVSIVRWKALE